MFKSTNVEKKISLAFRNCFPFLEGLFNHNGSFQRPKSFAIDFGSTSSSWTKRGGETNVPRKRKRETWRADLHGLSGILSVRDDGDGGGKGHGDDHDDDDHDDKTKEGRGTTRGPVLRSRVVRAVRSSSPHCQATATATSSPWAEAAAAAACRHDSPHGPILSRRGILTAPPLAAAAKSTTHWKAYRNGRLLRPHSRRLHFRLVRGLSQGCSPPKTLLDINPLAASAKRNPL